MTPNEINNLQHTEFVKSPMISLMSHAGTVVVLAVTFEFI